VQLRAKGLASDHPQDWKLVALMLSELGDETVYKDIWAVTAEIAEKVSGYGDVSRPDYGNRSSATSPFPVY